MQKSFTKYESTGKRWGRPLGRNVRYRKCHDKEANMRQNATRRFSLLSAIVMLLGPSMLYGIQPRTSTKLLRKRAWHMLWEGSHSSDAGQRAAAIEALGILHASREVVQIARRGLKDKDARVREAAATALGEMHSSSSIPELKRSLSDNNMGVALAAARSLLLLKQKAGYSVYYAVLTGKRKSGQSLLQQQLDQIDTPQKMVGFIFDQGIGFLPYAGYAMEVIQALTKKGNSPMRAAAARALAKDPDPRSGRALAKACSDKNWIVQVAALRAVATRGNPALLPYAEPDMQDGNNTVQYTAAATVFRLASIESLRANNM